MKWKNLLCLWKHVAKFSNQPCEMYIVNKFKIYSSDDLSFICIIYDTPNCMILLHFYDLSFMMLHIFGDTLKNLLMIHELMHCFDNTNCILNNFLCSMITRSLVSLPLFPNNNPCFKFILQMLQKSTSWVISVAKFVKIYHLNEMVHRKWPVWVNKCELRV